MHKIALNALRHIYHAVRVFAIRICMLLAYQCYSQHAWPQVNYVKKWPLVKIGKAELNSDGRYAYYIVNDENSASSVLNVCSTDGRWKLEVPEVNPKLCRFMSDGKRLAFLQKNTLYINVLGTDSSVQIPNVARFTTAKTEDNNWIAFEPVGSPGQLILQQLTTNRKRCYQNVTDYIFGNLGGSFVLQYKNDVQGVEGFQVNLVDLKSNRSRRIWQTGKARDFVYDNTEKQIAFICEKNENGHSESELVLFDVSTAEQRLLVNLHNGMKSFDNILSFSSDASRLFLTIKKVSVIKATKTVPENGIPSIWGYNSTYLFVNSNGNYDNHRTETVCLSIGNKQIVTLTGENESSDLQYSRYITGNFDKYVIVRKYKGIYGEGEWNWNIGADYSTYLVSTCDGSRTLLKKSVNWKKGGTMRLSNDQNFVVWYDPLEADYFSYCIKTGVTVNMSMDTMIQWHPDIDVPSSAFSSIGIAAFCRDNSLLVYDQHDIWKLDLGGKRKPVCVTNGFGRRKNIIFRLGLSQYQTVNIPESEKLVLSAFNKTNKDNGYYSSILDGKQDPQLLVMGSYVYSMLTENASFTSRRFPVKARDANCYLVARESALDQVNFFFTLDFKSFRRISNIQFATPDSLPKRELHSFRTLSGDTAQGILYKPRNFNSSKKYPVIIHYYEGYTDQLNRNQEVESIFGPLNIPWFVENDYLVFTPDIQYEIGRPGFSALSVVEGAGYYLSTLPYVMSQKLGLQGHSYGGYETNFILTHSNLFAAAVASSGYSNMISHYNSVMTPTGGTLQDMYETFQNRMGTTLWDAIDQYIKNSPVFSCRYAGAPVLMMNNELDGIIPVEQGIEFYLGLKELGKSAWMLQYHGEFHTLSEEKNRLDFSNKIMRFFDHYLKGLPAPHWMLHDAHN